MKKLTYEFIKSEFENENYQLLSDDYINARIKLDYICPKGHRHSITWNRFQSGRRCWYCANEKLSERQKGKGNSMYGVHLCGEKNPNWKDGISLDRKEYRKQYHLDHKEKYNEFMKQRYQNNKERENKRGREYYQNSLEKCKEYMKQYAKNNPDKACANSAKHRAAKRNQTPANASMSEINKIYSICAYMNSISINCKWHIDHIKPLDKGGLHHQDNLQILDAIANIKKSNKYEIIGQEG
ncbi:hypothetical protein LCGC14_0537280 [marine sediment metagenome]|uniref:CapR homology domain-containing protein n=1 Tax=marine sediment metagenome TaxID=412755 RepID=A0A0F9V211_9ZZZZ